MVSPSNDWIFQLYVKQLARPKLQPDHFYYENGKMVMTEQYHLDRGYCCGNQCRHCPYNNKNVKK